MAPTRVPARDIIIQVSDGAATPVWTEIGGLTSAIINKSENEEAPSAATFDSGGHHEEDVLQRGAMVTMVGQMLQDATTGELDPGQALCETNAQGVGAASHGAYRFRYPSDTNWTVWDATTRIGEIGGETNGFAAWNCTLRRSGPSTSEAVV
ncbi:hypothetical protein FZ103_00295 [Streptomonospora sp. PA3]|uniref:phage tail tube protein n=1 Tax=Streptomonospora sp. PA3 TaxID=2607326 RepID=UPI0012DD1DF0|nr:hypothetical protein [Streptomonospora sp. PA3]MUL39633.1 hypothetical protein [Streptomonospora sp. PA3]